jgi:hypothetical protein
LAHEPTIATFVLAEVQTAPLLWTLFEKKRRLAMTEHDAKRIEDAATILLRVVRDAKTAVRTLPVSRELQERISLRTAREILEATDAWKNAK